MREVREVRQVREPVVDYRPPNLLEMPTFGDEDQYVYRWIRVMVPRSDNPDYGNISMRLREGWVFVQAADVPQDFRGYQGYETPGQKQAQLEGCLRQGDLVLAKIPKSKALAYKRYVEGKATQMEGDLDRRLLYDKDSGAVLHNESTHRVTKGQVHFDD